MVEFSMAELWAYGIKLVRIILILIVAHMALKFWGALVDSGAGRLKIKEEKRFRTVNGLLRSIARYVIDFLAIILILQEFHVDTTSFIAGAGIIGLAIGVGAQSLIKDFVSGFFIIMEDQYAIGDYIAIGDMAGTVEDMGFRITRLRDANGVLHVIPNGSIQKTTNYTRGAMQASVDVPVSYDADLDKVLAVINEACAATARLEEVIEGPEILGITDFAPNAVRIRVIARVNPLMQASVETKLRYEVKTLFAQRGIAMYDKITIGTGGLADG